MNAIPNEEIRQTANVPNSFDCLCFAAVDDGVHRHWTALLPKWGRLWVAIACVATIHVCAYGSTICTDSIKLKMKNVGDF